ncbi:hypothetical protein GMRT_12691 [Giardia muris]|uniref:Uncharacterized protein n=1 Tax=Giardia muris TaxID=5742 RepID=A0A4Z1SXN9_GIAMU|nr:hypothetical protein GMRT_12691 [Giardia muris]|eukprot:TNJ30484.1 hypothetical protein GMRT_12691 [Giardia muris]
MASPMALVNSLEYNKRMILKHRGQNLDVITLRYTGEDLRANQGLLAAFHAVYTHILPDVDKAECREDLLKPGTVHIGVFRSEGDVRADWRTRPIRILRHYRTDPSDEVEANSSFSGPTDDEEDTGDRMLLKALDFVRNQRSSRESGTIKKTLPELHRRVLDGRMSDEELDSSQRKVRPKDMILGAASILIRDSVEGIDEPCKMCQLVYIGVRTRFQLLKLGRQLLATSMYQEAVQTFDCNVYFTYAGSNAIRFFRYGGLDDDPLLAGRYAHIDNQWTDVLPMVRILKSPIDLTKALQRLPGVTNRSRVYAQWRDATFKRYAEEATFVSHLISELDFLQQRVTKLEQTDRNYNTVLTQERSRCIMYEQIIARLETQLLAAGITPDINRDEIMQTVIEKMTETKERM